LNTVIQLLQFEPDGAHTKRDIEELAAHLGTSMQFLPEKLSYKRQHLYNLAGKGREGGGL
jgi:hypothetical protein